MPSGAGGGRVAWALWGLPVAIGVAAGTVFLALPGIGLGAGRPFFEPGRGLVGGRLGWGEALRWGFRVLYFGTIALCLAGLGLSWRARPQWLGLGRRHWLFLAACLAAGPGLIANLVLKDQWGRARPKQTV